LPRQNNGRVRKIWEGGDEKALTRSWVDLSKGWRFQPAFLYFNILGCSADRSRSMPSQLSCKFTTTLSQARESCQAVCQGENCNKFITRQFSHVPVMPVQFCVSDCHLGTEDLMACNCRAGDQVKTDTPVSPKRHSLKAFGGPWDYVRF